MVAQPWRAMAGPAAAQDEGVGTQTEPGLVRQAADPRSVTIQELFHLR